MTAYYNENDPYCAQWLRNLIDAGHIAPGVVDERDIREVEAFELQSFTQCHFFAGIGIWSLALRRAGWPDDQAIWTGSCPCQPFSNAGKQKGFLDDRHLWPYWFSLIEQCRPSIVIGEQVASALAWLDLVSTDLEGAQYAFGAGDLCAAGFGGAHIRQRLFFVGMADDDDDTGSQGRSGMPECGGERFARQVGVADWMADPTSGNPRAERSERGGKYGLQPQGEFPVRSENCGSERDTVSRLERPHAPMLGRNAADWLYCRDGKWRAVEPGTFPLAHEATQRVGRLRAYGNGLDAETATEFCSAVAKITAIRPLAREYDL